MTCAVDTPHLLMEMRRIYYRSYRLDSKNNKDKSGLSPGKHFSLFQSLQVRLTFSFYFVLITSHPSSFMRKMFPYNCDTFSSDRVNLMNSLVFIATYSSHGPKEYLMTSNFSEIIIKIQQRAVIKKNKKKIK